MATPSAFPVAEALEKITGKSGQELVNLLAQHLMHIGRRGNGGHQLPPLLGMNRKKESRTCTPCQDAADIVLQIEAVLLGQTAIPAVETEGTQKV